MLVILFCSCYCWLGLLLLLLLKLEEEKKTDYFFSVFETSLHIITTFTHTHISVSSYLFLYSDCCVLISFLVSYFSSFFFLNFCTLFFFFTFLHVLNIFEISRVIYFTIPPWFPIISFICGSKNNHHHHHHYYH